MVAQTALEQLKSFTTVVADSGDINAIQEFKPQDATTNPSLILAASKLPQYQNLLDQVIAEATSKCCCSPSGTCGNKQLLVDDIVDHLIVAFATEILKVIPGWVSVEVDPSLSFDTDGSIAKGRKLVSLFPEEFRDRVLIKLATTWESIQAAKVLESENIRCNMTLMFSLCQAIAAAEVNATLISPFVGRIMDWYKKSTGRASYAPEEDPGVLSVRNIYQYYKKFNYKTIIMGASFRNTGEVLALAGCDRLTISPALLKELDSTVLPDALERKLTTDKGFDADLQKLPSMNEKTFRWMLNEDAMATEKLAEGIRSFKCDLDKLKLLISERSGISATL